MKIGSKRMFYRLTKGNKNAEYTTFTTFMDKRARLLNKLYTSTVKIITNVLVNHHYIQKQVQLTFTLILIN